MAVKAQNLLRPDVSVTAPASIAGERPRRLVQRVDAALVHGPDGAVVLGDPAETCAAPTEPAAPVAPAARRSTVAPRDLAPPDAPTAAPAVVKPRGPNRGTIALRDQLAKAVDAGEPVWLSEFSTESGTRAALLEYARGVEGWSVELRKRSAGPGRPGWCVIKGKA